MPKLNIPVKQEGDLFMADEATQIVQAVNEVDVEAKKSTYALSEEYFIEDGIEIVDGEALPKIIINPNVLDDGSDITRNELLEILDVIPDNNLAPKYFAGVTGSGLTEDDPFVFTADLAVQLYLKSLPGWSNTEDRVLFGTGGVLAWGPPPEGGTPTQLGNGSITVGTPGPNNLPLTWTSIPSAVNYTVEISINSDFTGSTVIYNGAALGHNATGLLPNTTYYVRYRGVAPGYLPGEWAIDQDSTINDGWTNLALSRVIGLNDAETIGDPIVTAIVGFSSAGRWGTDIAIADGVAGKVRALLNRGTLALGTLENWENRDTLRYGIECYFSNDKLNAFYLNNGGQDSPTISIPVLATIELTTTGGTGGIGEVIMYYGNPLIELKRFNRVAGTLRLKGYADEEVTVSNIQYQGGFA